MTKVAFEVVLALLSTSEGCEKAVNRQLHARGEA
jgi:hypothetical protein